MVKSTVLITGADGFVGKNLFKALKKRKIKPVKFKGNIVHLAALTSLPESINSPLDYFMVNELGTVGILEYARINGIKRVIFMSSIAAKRPDNPYGLSKALAEEWCKLYSKLYGIETIMIRPYNIYGKGGHGVINIFAKQKLEGKKLTIHGSGKQKRDFIHIDDITNTICTLLEMKTGRLVSIKNIAKMIEECPKKKLEELV